MMEAAPPFEEEELPLPLPLLPLPLPPKVPKLSVLLDEEPVAVFVLEVDVVFTRVGF
jgi:hypothetical protein